MVRGTVPRQPAKSGRHEGVRSVPRGQQSRGPSRQPKRDGGTGVPARAAARTAKAAAKTKFAKPGASPKGYNPLAPGRIAAILAGLDQL
jgi:hypothetical protein